jgi:hypothetical protein
VVATHELKIWPEFYAAVASGIKPFEVRWGDDRPYAVGDQVNLREWDPAVGAYTGRWTGVWLDYVARVDPARFGVLGTAVWLLGWHVSETFQEAPGKGKE